LTEFFKHFPAVLTELSANIIKLNQALTGDADIRRISLVGCNIDSDNPTDNSDSQYGRKMLEKLSQSNIKVPVVVRSHYVAVDEHGRKITFLFFSFSPNPPPTRLPQKALKGD
jgi:hypothetical protein